MQIKILILPEYKIDLENFLKINGIDHYNPCSLGRSSVATMIWYGQIPKQQLIQSMLCYTIDIIEDLLMMLKLTFSTMIVCK
jgi:hypothetical protein